ncbi:uncharacterized protein LOC129592252 [Paramacrobiotus metropolitanus]|uniref:uncharacterized protein LOC129592252 n=1 Tax=Paramacrobiotus metropolitanus TaxID=2943436 RepID=UPI0024461AE8|nr:uncharacterized protein LOC129592252 [Paramacrobiotus metropolitanus]
MDRENRLYLAVQQVRNGTFSLRAAAKLYRIPKTTLRDKVQGKPAQTRGSWSRKFTDAEETYLANFLLKCADIGVPMNKSFLRRLVVNIALQKGMGATFSHAWLDRFLKRNPEISYRVTHGVNRKKCREWTAETCQGWVTLLSELHIDGWLDDANGIWNLDESAFSTAEKVDFVFTRKGTKNILSYYDGNDRELITVLAGGNAAGFILRPLILYDGKMHLTSRIAGTEDRCWLGVNRSGIMDNDVFLEYFEKEVIPNMTAEKNLVMLDGHSSHVYNEEFLLKCVQSEKNIRVVIFPAGQTSKTQPLDLKVFGPVKRAWKNVLREKNLSVASVGVSKQNFAFELMNNWKTFNMDRNIVSGFAAAGIYPYDPAVVCKDFPGVAPETQPVTSLPASVIYAENFVEIRQVFRNIHAYTESQINQIMEFSKRVLDGFVPLQSAETAAKEYKELLNVERPAKRRYNKDARLDTQMGAIATESAFLDALKEKSDNKKRRQKKSNSSQIK